MNDFLGKEISVGDEVVFVNDANRNPGLRKGFVRKIYTNDKECTVDNKSHVFSRRIMKIEAD